jgi:hypothetical protein
MVPRTNDEKDTATQHTFVLDLVARGDSETSSTRSGWARWVASEAGASQMQWPGLVLICSFQSRRLELSELQKEEARGHVSLCRFA